MDLNAILQILQVIIAITNPAASNAAQDVQEIAGKIGGAEGSYIGPGFNPEGLYPADSQWLQPDFQAIWAETQFEQTVGLSREAMNVATSVGMQLPNVARQLDWLDERNRSPQGNAELAQTTNSIGLVTAQTLAGIAGLQAEQLQIQTDRYAKEAWSKDQAVNYYKNYYGDLTTGQAIMVQAEPVNLRFW